MKNLVLSALLDGLTVLGAVVFVYGLWRAWHPLGLIVGGALVSGAAFFGGYRSHRRER